MGTVFLNGAFVRGAEAKVAALDAGLQHGVGLFETMLGGVSERGGERRCWVFRGRAHLERLARSAADLGLADSLRVDALAEAVEETITRNAGGAGAQHANGNGKGGEGGERVRVRLTITGGDMSLLARTGRGPTEPTLLIVVQPATVYPGAMFERGVGVVLADTRANPLNPFESHKTLNYWWRLSALRAASARGAGEAVVLMVTNHVCGGCVSNLLAVRGGEIVTPIARGEEAPGALPSPVLPGVTRGWALEWAARAGIAVRREMMHVEELLGAEEVVLTNSSWGVLPAVRVGGLGDERMIGEGRPGDVGRGMREAWLAAVEGEAHGARAG